MIETRLKNSCSMYSEYLRHCLKRMHNIFESGQYLNGNGKIEEFLAENIMEKLVFKSESQCDVNQDDEIYFSLAKEAFSMAFRDMKTYISRNDLSNEDLVFKQELTFDDFQSKIEAWRLACMINRYFLISDMAIIY